MTLSVEPQKYRLDDSLMRVMDLALAVLMLFVSALPMLFIAGMILLDDGRPVLFRQVRVGRGGRRFTILKFRTMTHDRNRATGSVMGPITAADRRKFETTVSGDPRITRTGRVLRPLHIDELPQILNVFSGDMSMVGVRPDVPVQEADYTFQEWSRRHVLRPGITGLAQIDGSVNNMAARTALDLEWVCNRSIKLYLIVLFRTFFKVLKRNSL